MKILIGLMLAFLVIPAQATVLTKTHCVVLATWTDIAVRLKAEGIPKEGAFKAIAMDMALSEDKYRIPMAEVYDRGRLLVSDLYTTPIMDSKVAGKEIMTACIADIGRIFN